MASTDIQKPPKPEINFICNEAKDIFMVKMRSFSNLNGLNFFFGFEFVLLCVGKIWCQK